jgi:hypothetical protein
VELRRDDPAYWEEMLGQMEDSDGLLSGLREREQTPEVREAIRSLERLQSGIRTEFRSLEDDAEER